MSVRDVKVYAAIDKSDMDEALALVKSLNGIDGLGIKTGLEFFSNFGLAGVKQLIEAIGPNPHFFLDLKFHDIPNTVAAAVRAVSKQEGISYINVHCAGGLEMMRAAKQAAGENGPKVIGVTILTSLDQHAIKDIGYNGTPQDNVLRLAKLAQEAGLDGVVCSPLEIELLRAELGDDFVLMTPGIRPAGSDKGDQKRVMTPAEAMRKGATHLVIGRPITQSDDPALAVNAILSGL